MSMADNVQVDALRSGNDIPRGKALCGLALLFLLSCLVRGLLLRNLWPYLEYADPKRYE